MLVAIAPALSGFFTSAACPLDAEWIARAVCSGREVENRLHSRPDVPFMEDQSRARSAYAASKLVIVRRIERNLPRLDTTRKAWRGRG